MDSLNKLTFVATNEIEEYISTLMPQAPDMPRVVRMLQVTKQLIGRTVRIYSAICVL